MSSLATDLDEIEEARRFAPKMYRTPEAQACEDMIRRFRYGLFEKPPVADPAPVAVTRIERVAELLRSLTYGEMIELAAGIWKAGEGRVDQNNLPGILWAWAVTHDRS